MMYFPKISSSFNVAKGKRYIQTDISALKSSLEYYIHWRNILAAECYDDVQKDKYDKLLSVLKEEF